MPAVQGLKAVHTMPDGSVMFVECIDGAEPIGLHAEARSLGPSDPSPRDRRARQA